MLYISSDHPPLLSSAVHQKGQAFKHAWSVFLDSVIKDLTKNIVLLSRLSDSWLHSYPVLSASLKVLGNSLYS